MSSTHGTSYVQAEAAAALVKEEGRAEAVKTARRAGAARWLAQEKLRRTDKKDIRSEYKERA